MLNAMEAKITSVVADGLQSRPSVTVLQAPTPLTASAGNGAIRVSLAEWAFSSSGFERDQIAFSSVTASHRIFAVSFKANLEFLRIPAGPSTAQMLTSRALLLEDMSLVNHYLADDDIRSGKLFQSAAPDPGFEVLSFELAKGSLPIGLANIPLSGLLEYRGRANIWPPNVSEEGCAA